MQHRFPPRFNRGLTLMEMLVTLVLVSLATMLMFQMLGTYRIANERVQAQSGVIDRGALFHAWFRDTVHGLYTAEGLVFTGAASGFSGISLNPLYGSEGAPMEIEWRIINAGNALAIAYLEGGRERWQRPLKGSVKSYFVFLDAEGRIHETWPPKLGEHVVDSLPAQIALVREDEASEQTMVAAVMGPLEPVVRLIGQDDY